VTSKIAANAPAAGGLTVANYDPDIIPLLRARVGSAFLRDPKTGQFVAMAGGEDEFPRVEGVYAMTNTWSIELPPGQFKRRLEKRLENESLVLWRDGITAWITVWGNVWGDDEDLPADKRQAAIRKDRSKKAFDLREAEANGVLYDSYRLKEKHCAASLYAFAFGSTGHVQMAVYVDDERDLELARAMWRGLREHATDDAGTA
jgi:hypothetical protein